MTKKDDNGLYIGTSGWMYKDWGKAFYPPEMKKGHLQFLAAEFNTVEVNSSFYHLPRASTFAKWKNETPERFVFAVKLSRFITHQKKLVDCKEPLLHFFTAARDIGEKLGVILIQLPPSLKYDHTAVEDFLKELRKAEKKEFVRKSQKVRTRFVLEPRNKTWMEHATDARVLLKKYEVPLVFPHSAKIPSFTPDDENILGGHVYVRFHGPSEFAASRYGAARLRPWAERIKKWRKKKLTVFVYFNNDIHGHAIHDARTLKMLCDAG
jgi:uncharacterized protein YecE (DUF72 family)